MGKITIEQAAQRLGTSQEIIRSWIEEGLLKVCRRQRRHLQTISPSADSSDSLYAFCLSSSQLLQAQDYVDEDELFQVAETMGWLMLTAETWDKNGSGG
ncbi:hypothetical protein HRbin15_01319 [bacterium HR15]|nr:hypothetical protein HRbin15_01319 [bacterium HR15]